MVTFSGPGLSTIRCERRFLRDAADLAACGRVGALRLRYGRTEVPGFPGWGRLPPGHTVGVVPRRPVRENGLWRMEEAVTETDGSVVAGGVDARPAVVDIEGRPRPIHERVIQRNRLLRRLDAAEAVRLVLVACPAGYGKTTLLADWGASRPDQRTVAWVSMDEMDNDPVVFWAHLVRALRRACLLYTSDAADEEDSVDLAVRRIIPR